MTGYRHADTRFPFLWEGPGQPAGRWNEAGGEPAQYFADTPDGAWAEFLRHEEIVDPADLETVTRAIWAVDLPAATWPEAQLPVATLTGSPASYPACRIEARRLSARGAAGLQATSAALLPAGATGWRVEGGLVPARHRDGRVIVLFGRRPELVGWRAAIGRPAAVLLPRVRPLVDARTG